MTRADRLDAEEQRQVLVRVEIFDQRVLELHDRLPAPHVLVPRADRRVTLRSHSRILPAGGRRLARDVRVGRRAQRRVFDQGAVAVAIAAVPSLHEPIETEAAVRRAGRFVDQLLHRNRAVRTCAVIVEIARHVAALRAADAGTTTAAAIAAAASATADGAAAAGSARPGSTARGRARSRAAAL